MTTELFIAPDIEHASIPAAQKTPSLDVVHIVSDSFGIDDARRLIEQAARRPIAAPVRSFVLCARTLTIEAQNALLKLFEDPPSTAAFYIVVPHESALIATLRSRLARTGEGSLPPTDDDARAFLSLTPAARLAEVAALQKKGDAERLTSLARQLARIAAKDDALPLGVRAEVAFAEAHIGMRGGSKKMLLEHLALTLPQVSV